jgi:hypothetical protein
MNAIVKQRAEDLRARLRREVREQAVAPVSLVKQLKAHGVDGPVARDYLVVDRNRWMMFAFGLLILCVLLFVMYNKAAADARRNTQLMYIKMYPDGTWDMDFFDSKRAVEFLPATIDSILTNWVKRLLQENPATVSADYGLAQLFMSDKAAAAFVDPKQGNAVAKAAKILNCETCPTKEIEIRNISHFDSEAIKIGAGTGAMYRTNVFIREKNLADLGTLTSTHRKILKVQWRLMSKREIQSIVTSAGGMDWVRANPIGLQILNYELLSDPSDEPVGAAETSN